MDFFGIGSAIKGCAVNFFAASRQTGRTTQLIESLNDGDRVVCLSHKDAAWLRDRIKYFYKGVKKDIEVTSIPTREVHKIFEMHTPTGRTIFDHDWLERYYIEQIEDIKKKIDHLQREASGFGAAHVETRMMKDNRAKFMTY